MEIKLINDKEDEYTFKLYKYDLNSLIEEDTRNGSYLRQDCYKLYTEDQAKYIRKFIIQSQDFHIYIIFDEDNIKRLYNPSVEIIDKNIIMVETLKTYLF